MQIPDKLPINRMEDYHTHYLGELEDGRLFWGYETFAYTPPFREIKDTNKLKYRKDYAVLHIFDSDGNLLQTSFKSANATDGQRYISDMLDEMISQLGKIEYKNIEVKVFEVLIDGKIFGLIPDHDFGLINLQPGSVISFQEPWNGEYYT